MIAKARNLALALFLAVSTVLLSLAAIEMWQEVQMANTYTCPYFYYGY